MNTLELAKRIAVDKVNKTPTIYVITGHFRLLPDFNRYEVLPQSIASLFSTNEEKISQTTEYIKTLNRLKETGVQFTNNPYVIAYYNNCILAGQLNAPGFTKLEVQVKSYHVFPDGECVYQIDTETQFINAEYVDSLSDILASDFEKLIDLKISQEKPKNTHKCTCKGNCNKESNAKETLKKKSPVKKNLSEIKGRVRCENCGDKFEPKSYNHKFCSKDCKSEFWKKVRRQESHLHPLCDDNFDGEMH